MVLRIPITWTEHRHVVRGGKQRTGLKFDKTDVNRYAAASGLRAPAIFRTFDSPHSIRLGDLPGDFVLKPNELFGKRGVMLLKREENAYFESLGRRSLTEKQIVDEQARWNRMRLRRGYRPLTYLAQERIYGENDGDIPFDYKLYTFHGEVRFILQIDRNVSPPAAAFFIDEFETFEQSTRIESDWKLIVPGTPVVPACHREIVAAAKRLSIDLALPFVSIDTYATRDGPVIGEITPTPGAPYFGKMFRFTPAFDRDLGLAWTAAYRSLGLEPPLFDDDVKIEQARKRGLPSRLPLAKQRGAAPT